MILLRNLAIQGFRSFQKDELLTFPEEPYGFYLLTGKNKLHPSLGSNGSGKSTVWDALTWVFFGRSARGLKARNIANWEDAHATSVCVEFEFKGKICNVTRTWNPNTLTFQDGEDADPELITQEDLQAKLDLDYTVFQYTVLMGQFSPFFFDLSPSDKLSVFTDALNLDVWIEASEKARELGRELDEEIALLRTKEARHKARLTLFREQLRDAKEREAKEEKEMEQRRSKAVADIKIQKRYYKEWVAKQESIRWDHKKCSRKLDAARDELKKNAEGQLKCELIYRKELDRIKQINREIDALDSRVGKLKSLTGECPVCFQSIDKDHKHGVETSLASSKAELLKSRELAEMSAAGKLMNLSGWRSYEGELEDKVNDLQLSLKHLDAALVDVAAQVARSKAAKMAAKEALQATSGPNPHAAHVRSLRSSLREAKERERNAARRTTLAQTRRSHYSYWVEGFRDIRLWIVEHALTELEILVNNALIDLGLEGWTVHFEVERENQSGGITKGFNVTIISPEHNKPVPWETWSGGETQRLRIAGAIGLAALIKSRRRFRANLEVWDEPTAFLSQEGIDDLLAYFSERSRTEEKQIWLVDHRSLDAGGFDNQFVVVKDDTGSHIFKAKTKAIGYQGKSK